MSTRPGPALSASHRSRAQIERDEAHARAEARALESEIHHLETLAATGGEGFGEVGAALVAARCQFAVTLERLDRAQRDRARLAADAQRQAQAAERKKNRPPAGGPATGRPPRAIADTDGYHLCPDPLTACDPAEFMAALRRWRIWAGEPSYRDMARLSRTKLAPSTLCRALRSEGLPALAIVQAVITGGGGSGDDQRRWATAWRRIRLGQEDTTTSYHPPGRHRIRAA